MTQTTDRQKITTEVYVKNGIQIELPDEQHAALQRLFGRYMQVTDADNAAQPREKIDQRLRYELGIWNGIIFARDQEINRIVGVVTTQREEYKRTTYISALVVDEDAERKGIGRILAQTAVAAARQDPATDAIETIPVSVGAKRIFGSKIFDGQRFTRRPGGAAWQLLIHRRQ